MPHWVHFFVSSTSFQGNETQFQTSASGSSAAAGGGEPSKKAKVEGEELVAGELKPPGEEDKPDENVKVFLPS